MLCPIKSAILLHFDIFLSDLPLPPLSPSDKSSVACGFLHLRTAGMSSDSDDDGDDSQSPEQAYVPEGEKQALEEARSALHEELLDIEARLTSWWDERRVSHPSRSHCTSGICFLS